MDYSIPIIYPAGSELVSPTNKDEKIVAKCCMNPACNCTCFYICGQLSALETHKQHHCDDCGKCLCDHGLADILHLPRITPNNKIKRISGQIPILIQEFLTPGCKNKNPPPSPADWVDVYREL